MRIKQTRKPQVSVAYKATKKILSRS